MTDRFWDDYQHLPGFATLDKSCIIHGDFQQTTVNEAIFHVVADNRPAQESTPRTYCIGVDAADAMRRSLPLLIFSRRCRMCRDLTQVISKNPREHIATIANHCSLEQDYLPPVTPMKEAIFRTLLAHDNAPMSVERISGFLGKKWAMTHFPRDTSPRAIRHLLDNSGCYCIVSSDSECAREEKENDDSVRWRETFAGIFFEALTPDPSNAPDRPDILPAAGPQTKESARRDVEQAVQTGRSGSRVRKEVTRWEPTEVAQELADQFRDMARNDYGSRCQVCGQTFQSRSGRLYTSIAHVVPPSSDTRTNNFGNLMSLCGLHYEHVRHGQWAMLNPKTNEPFQNPEQVREYFLGASPEIDNNGNSYVSVPVRFYNIYRKGGDAPTTEYENIRYSVPHWEYLCELFRRNDR